MANDVIAKVERVSHRYGKTLALDNVTFDIPTGQMIGIVERRLRWPVSDS